MALHAYPPFLHAVKTGQPRLLVRFSVEKAYKDNAFSGVWQGDGRKFNVF